MTRGLFVRSALLSSVALCWAVPSLAQSNPLAGPKPIASQTGRSAGCLGDVQLGSNVGDPRVANGVRSGQSWKIASVTTTPAICSFPSARPVDVSCVRDGRAVDPSYCQDGQFQQLLGQGYTTVNDSRDWSTAQWLLPGQTDSGCMGEWRSSDGSKPMGCGPVQVPVASTCVVTNVQSGTPDNAAKYCTTAAPAAFRSDIDYRACGYTIETGGWGQYSGACGQVYHDRALTCRRADGTTLDLMDANCAPLLATYCASHSCQSSGNSTRDRESISLPACTDYTRNVWQTGTWISGGQTCGNDTQTRSISCLDTTENVTVDESACDPSARPAASQVENVTSGCVPAPTPTPTPAPAPTGNGTACIGGRTVSTGGGDNVRNWPDDLTAQCSQSGGNCFEDTGADLHDQEQNSYYWIVHNWRCVADATSTGPGTDGLEAQMITAGSTPTPTPTPPPVTYSTIVVGYCRYTSGGGSGRHACGDYSNIFYQNKPSDPPKPEQICSGGAIGSEDTNQVGPNWQKPAVHTSIPAGTQCIIDQKIIGYSDDVNESWRTTYFSGPATGLPGGTYIIK